MIFVESRQCGNVFLNMSYCDRVQECDCEARCCLSFYRLQVDQQSIFPFGNIVSCPYSNVLIDNTKMYIYTNHVHICI
jgi:hypothetical protein